MAISLRRAYGANLVGHKAVFRQCGILAAEVFSPNRGKNSADHVLIVDAMRELYRGLADSICIVSADGDFTRLAQAWREEGKDVLAFGPNQTPLALRSACTEFSVLGSTESCTGIREMPATAPNALGATNENALLKQLMGTVQGLTETEGQVRVGRLCAEMRQHLPGFAPRNYKAKTMTKLLRRLEALELKPLRGRDGSICEYQVDLRA